MDTCSSLLGLSQYSKMGENEIVKVLIMQLNIHFCFSYYLFSVYSGLAYLELPR